MKAPGIATQALLLLAVVLAIYYPAIYAPYNPVDDRALIQWLYDSVGTPLWSLFSSSQDVYYRPVLLATFFLDMWLWGAEASFMHLENILLHALNVLLLFACARIVFATVLPTRSWAAFVAALFFAIHPINSEAVIWISGRSDVLACSFMLGALLLLLHGLRVNKPVYSWYSFLLLIPGILAKETAVFFVPTALILIAFAPPLAPSTTGGETGRRRLFFALPFFTLPVVYISARGLLSRDGGINFIRKFFTENGSGSLDTVWTLLAGIGFYTKKLIFPWPLNFTISHVPTYYGAIGVVVIVLLCICVYRRDWTGGLFLGSAVLASSALLALLLRPAWTPVAERYLYLPATLFALAVVIAVAQGASNYLLRRDVVLLLLLVFSGTALATLDRTLLWQDNLALFEDTVNKNPDFPFARSTLAVLLFEAGRGEEGAAMVRANTAPEGLRNADFLDLQRAVLLTSEGRHAEARTLIFAKRRREGQLYIEFQKLLLNVDLKLFHALTGGEQQGLRTEIMALFEELVRGTGDPFYHYRLGQFLLQEGDLFAAGRSFRLAAEGAPPGTTYKKAAERLAGKLAP